MESGKSAGSGEVTNGAATSSRAVSLRIRGELRAFDIDDPVLPDWVENQALASNGHPYDKKMKKEAYEEELKTLQIELVKVQFWLQATGKRVMALFEGRDAAGKGGTIHSILEYMNPRLAHNIALTKPTETESGQWYFQRYIAHFPSAGNMSLFDRSWYNRAIVEPVMGFCTQEQYDAFMEQVPRFEKLIHQEGIHFFKFWLEIGQEMQIKRFHDRRHDPLKVWKLSTMDIAALDKWSDYTDKRDRMLKQTHTKDAPWMVARANDKRRAHLNVIRHILMSLNYEGRDLKAIGEIDKKIIGEAPDMI
ncbi:polyphosphate kinase 2 [Allorhizobium taibaishanense]|uniref:ADP/GDP-polyphosphate phosphotransferase n=1 Tax=Allorhizobium taibaishanense TaxID=887144 RepID=A0A1Q9A8V3_9HYPH|nr:polyphosphate kinase 2 [Allorhizobium taibaishanense]MBB4009463.1 polyphosphate kinase 2 [Allorhizobium taibaishanense]OLP50995.1 polyphosphate kinase 2 [Allorhizobium taibaishanense]